MTLRFGAAYAWRSLLRQGQRSALAVLCVAFGVASLVSLQQLASVMRASLLVPPRVAAGGDLRLTAPEGRVLEPDRVQLDSLGVTAITSLAHPGIRLLKTADSGRVTILSQVVGVDPDRFPLYGSVHVARPKDARVSDVLGETGAALVTQDIALRLEIEVGDTLSLFGAPDAAPFAVRVTGVADRTPDRKGGSVYVSRGTLRSFGVQATTTVLIRHEAPERIATVLEVSGWNVEVVPKRTQDDAGKSLTVMLAGAGMLGLLVGGIGVANTVHVLLARRRVEIATLKALGYREHHLLILFGMELLLLGVMGSGLGVALGSGLAYALMRVLNASLPFLLAFDVSPSIVIGGVGVGVATTLIFGVVSIVGAAHVRPSMLVRGDGTPPAGRRRGVTLGLNTLLISSFGVLSGLVVDSVWKGFAIVVGGLLGLLIVGGVLTWFVRMACRIPIPGLPLLGLARRNVRRQSRRVAVGLVALFVGVVAIGSAMITMVNAMERREGQTFDRSGVNVHVFASTADEFRLVEILDAFEVKTRIVDVPLSVEVKTAAGERVSVDVAGRRTVESSPDIAFADRLDIATERVAYVEEVRGERAGVAPGDTLELENARGRERLVIAGTYRISGRGTNVSGTPTLLVPVETAVRLSPESTAIQMSIAVDPERVAALSEALGRAAPRSVVIDKDAVWLAISGFVRAFFWFVAAIAGLALVAGAVLIANAVALSLLERRRELGVLKAIGYASRHVLATVVFEQTLLGVIAGVAGVVGLHAGVLVTNRLAPDAHLSLTAVQSVVLVVTAVLLATGSAMLAAWTPSHVRPLVVLRED